MREILFRGKRIFHLIVDDERSAMNDQKWVFGTYYVSRYEDLTGIIEEGHYIETSEIEYNNHAYIPCSSGSYEVDPETVGQYTGLTDKNGVKIFEGDIIKGKEKTTYVVEYCSEIASFCARAVSPQKMLPCMTTGTMKYYEVIGNIHDNPELLGARTE